ncbi:MAG: hypothetical protein ABFS03_04620 [Chloroflexota bacterium]
MFKLIAMLAGLILFAVNIATAGMTAPKVLKDLYFGEALYYAFQEDWFDAITRLDTELDQHHGLDERERDTLYYHINHAEFAVGDLELAYRMHQRAGRAITAVIEGNVEEPVRNEAIYRLARIYFQKDQPVNAQFAMERINGVIPDEIREDLGFLRSQILISNGNYDEAVEILRELQKSERFEGFATYNLGIVHIKSGKTQKGRNFLDLAGQVKSDQQLNIAMKDKANFMLGSKLLEEKEYENAKIAFDRVRLKGLFSNRALLGSGWADAYQGNFERALVPWSALVGREVTDASVQEAMIAVPYAYGKLNVYSKAALMYDSALLKFQAEIDKLNASIKSIHEGYFLKALVREELKQNVNWVVKLRSLPQTPETYYLLELMASHDFQESLKNYLDLEQLRKKLENWKADLTAFEDLIAHRRAYYKPLLPLIDKEFRRLDSQMRLRIEQRDRIEKRLKNMLIAPRPDYLATSGERVISEQIIHLEERIKQGGIPADEEIIHRINRLRGILKWNIYTQYDHRLTEAYTHLYELNYEIYLLKKQYTEFVRSRQAATQSYQGYEDGIGQLWSGIRRKHEEIGKLMDRQGHMVETMAVNELKRRREHLSDSQTKARFAMADSYDRATRKKSLEKVNK